MASFVPMLRCMRTSIAAAAYVSTHKTGPEVCGGATRGAVGRCRLGGVLAVAADWAGGVSPLAQALIVEFVIADGCYYA